MTFAQSLFSVEQSITACHEALCDIKYAENVKRGAIKPKPLTSKFWAIDGDEVKEVSAEEYYRLYENEDAKDPTEVDKWDTTAEE